MSKHYLGYMPSGRREIFTSAKTPTRETHGHRYKSYRGPLTLTAAHYLKFREENGYPALPPETSVECVDHIAIEDPDPQWQEFLMALLESQEYNPDLHPEAGYPIFVSCEASYA